MKYFDRLKPVAVGGGILLVIGIIEFLVVGPMKQQANSIVRDTLPGLSYGGKIGAETSENFVRTLLVITTASPEERAAYKLAIEEGSRSVDMYLAEYEKAIFETQDRLLFDTLKTQRRKYTALRSAVLDLMDTNRQEEALRLFKTQLLPSYKEYRITCDSLFDYNRRQGDAKGMRILRVCTTTQYLVTVIGFLVFLGGFLTPFIVVRFPPEAGRTLSTGSE